jgi:hypothetical protein
MESTTQTQPTRVQEPPFLDAWQFVLGQLQSEMSRASFETWVQPLQPLSYESGIFRVGAFNPYALDWVQNRLKNRISHILEGTYNHSVELRLEVVNSFSLQRSKSTIPRISEGKNVTEIQPNQGVEPPASNRKMMLQRAYGSERAKLVQPERGMFVTLYFFCEWLPLLGHSAFATVLASRSLCYWNPMTGELRNTIETEMGELAQRAAVSVRTIKDVLSNELVKQYFLRYLVRRVMTPNGVRTAGISLQVRMDDPLTPQDQQLSGIAESENWYSPEFENEDEGDS